MWRSWRPDLIGAIAVGCLALLPPQESLAPGIERLVDRIEERYENVDLEARFVQNRLSRLGSVMTSHSGKLYVRSPGRMRWEYETVEQLLVVSGVGREMYFYQPADNHVDVVQTDTSSPRQFPILYLAGRGRLRRDFDIEVTEWGAPLSRNNVQLELRPRRGENNFERLILEVDPVQATIARLVSFDNLRNAIDYQFRDVEYDAGLSDDLFEFEIPAGAEVVFIGR